MAIGNCRACGRMIGYEEWKCPHCGVTEPVVYPWLAQRQLPTGTVLERRWRLALLIALALAALVAFCA